MSFRKKILLSYILVFVLFVALIYPIASGTVKNVVFSSLSDRAYELIEKIQYAADDEALVQRLKDQKYRIFFRVSLITSERKVLYDSYTKRLLGPRFNKNLEVSHPEVEEAFEYGIGSSEGYSKLLGQNFFYIATEFESHGKSYVLRIAFPYEFVAELSNNFELGIIGILIVILLLFSLMTWVVLHYLTRPIQQIITAVKPYQEGAVAALPTIEVDAAAEDDFGKLAHTLNSMSAKIQTHIDTLTYERNQKKTILESLVEGVIAVDDKFFVTYANQTALTILGAEPDQITGHPFTQLHQQKCFELLQRCQKKNTVLVDTLQLTKEGKRYYLDIVASPQIDQLGGILVMADKTEHYKLLEMRKDFVANASHELKTPITIIRGFSETLHDHPDLPQETRISITGKIMDNCKRMATLIRDLLSLTDIENVSQSRMLECDLYSLVHTCSEMVRDLFPTAEITINNRIDKGPHAIADANLMELAVMNLLENSAKYSKPPAKITITLDREDGWVKLVIADKGIGIPTGDLEHIFDRFYTVNKAHSRKLGGSGLGLSIVRTVIERHSGRISVESKLGHGTAFTILLPAITG